MPIPDRRSSDAAAAFDASRAGEGLRRVPETTRRLRLLPVPDARRPGVAGGEPGLAPADAASPVLVQEVLAPLGRKLARLGVGPAGQAAVLGSAGSVERVTAETAIVGPSAGSPSLPVLLEGMAARCKLGPDGERQILGFCVPGDLLSSHPAPVPDHGVTAITDCKIVRIPRRGLYELVERDPTLARALWRDAAAEAAIAREWLFNLGRRSAAARLAHLLCEMHVRLEQAGVAAAPQRRLAVSQRDMADASGLSLVHVNRQLKALCRLGLIGIRRRQISIADAAGLCRAAGFDAGYLKTARE